MELEALTLAEVRRALRRNPVHSVRRKVLAAYVVGSCARPDKEARPDSDIDVAVVIPAFRRKSALRFTEEYYEKLSRRARTPEACERLGRARLVGRLVDFQFFFEGCPALAGYSKIAIGKEPLALPFARAGNSDAGAEATTQGA